MAEKGYVSAEMFAGRINVHGKITELPFTSSNPVSILVVPKADVTDGVISNIDTNIGIVVSCKTYQNDEAADLPVYFHRWTEAAILEIPADAINLTTYDVYRGGGQI